MQKRQIKGYSLQIRAKSTEKGIKTYKKKDSNRKKLLSLFGARGGSRTLDTNSKTLIYQRFPRICWQVSWHFPYVAGSCKPVYRTIAALISSIDMWHLPFIFAKSVKVKRPGLASFFNAVAGAQSRATASVCPLRPYPFKSLPNPANGSSLGFMYGTYAPPFMAYPAAGTACLRPAPLVCVHAVWR